MIEYNKNTYILLFAFIFFSLKINAQRVKVIDNKGTIKMVNSTVTTNATGIAPTTPLEGDIWFDTLNSEIKIYDTEPLSAPIWRNMSGYYTDNIYNIDGNLTSNRFVGGGGNQLRFSGFDRFDIDNANYVLLQSNGYFDIRATTGINLYSDTRITGNISVQGGYRDSGSNYGNVGQILSSTNTGTSWIDNTAAITGTTGSIFFAGATGNPTENNDQLFWDETNKRLQVGLAFTNNINNKLNVRGAIRTTGLNNADGTVGTPSYRFTADKDTGMYKPAADEIGLVVGGKEAINIDETSNNTTVTIKETLKLDGTLLDVNNQSGTAGQILSSTGIATEWIDNSSLNWSVLGNSGTTNTNFLGTTNAQPLILKTNNIEKLRLHETKGQVLINGATSYNNHPFVIKANGNDILAFQDNNGSTKWHWNILGDGLNFVETGIADYRLFLEYGGNVGIGTNNPSEKLDINGKLKIRDIPTVTTNNEILTTTATGVVEKKVLISTDANNLLSAGTDGGVYLNIATITPIKAMGKVNADGTPAKTPLNSTITKLTGQGRYRINLTATAGINNTNYIIQLTIRDSAGVGNDDYDISYNSQQADSFIVEIGDNDNGGGNRTLRDLEFMYTVLDY